MRHVDHGTDLPGGRLALAASMILLTGGIALAGPGDPAPFTDEAQARGLDYTPSLVVSFGQGLAFVDLDDDGDPDVVALGRADKKVGIFENLGNGTFVDRIIASGIPALPATSGVAAADYDRDGDLDVYVSRWEQADLLLANEGGFQFTDVTAAAGMGDTGAGVGIGWGDYDLDGHIDLYLSNRNGPNRLYHNLGNGQFEEIGVAMGVDRGDDPTFQGTFFDFNRDSWPDLYLATDRGDEECFAIEGRRNHLFKNVGGTFVDITSSSGTEACADAMSVTIGDFDANGWADIYVTNTPPGNKLLMNQGDETFIEVGVAAGVGSFAVGWGAIFFDYDHDQVLDLYVVNADAPNRLYVHGGSFPCVDLAPLLGVDDKGVSYTTAAADVDGDGDIDLLSMSHNEPLRLFINHEGETRNWAKFDVVGEGANRWAVGAVLDVRTGTDWQLREVIAGANFKTQDALIQHVGLADVAMIDEVQVVWPGGTARTLLNLAANQVWTVYPPDKLGDGDGDGDRDLDDYFLFAACFTGDTPGAIGPGCEMMDYEGDGDVDLVDFDGFLAAYDGVLEDCNENGIVDLIEILDGSAIDADGDGDIDACEAIPGDLDGDQIVGISDLLILLGSWGQSGVPADLNGDGTVDIQDVLILLANWT